ncbi:MAG: DNA-directed RNA polymerase subunit H [Sulfolobales archaeon]|jgi:DNA-directed RNA polymerase subunit H
MSKSRSSKSGKSQSKPEFDIFKHELVPKHEIVPVEEAVKILRELGVKPEELPWIRASDPAVIAIGGKPGDIIRIIRKSPTAGEIVVYRYVIAG